MNGKKVIKTDEEWKAVLTPEQYHVTREKGTDPPFSGEYVHTNEKGMYVCSNCGNELFSSDTKFDSGPSALLGTSTGWPSFHAPALRENVELEPDKSLGIERTEVICSRCGAHLGHVFDDLPRQSDGKAGGPEPTGKRYCINSMSLEFTPEEKKISDAAP